MLESYLLTKLYRFKIVDKSDPALWCRNSFLIGPRLISTRAISLAEPRLLALIEGYSAGLKGYKAETRKCMRPRARAIIYEPIDL